MIIGRSSQKAKIGLATTCRLQGSISQSIASFISRINSAWQHLPWSTASQHQSNFNRRGTSQNTPCNLFRLHPRSTTHHPQSRSLDFDSDLRHFLQRSPCLYPTNIPTKGSRPLCLPWYPRNALAVALPNWIIRSTHSVVASYKPPMLVTWVRFPVCAFCQATKTPWWSIERKEA